MFPYDLFGAGGLSGSSPANIQAVDCALLCANDSMQIPDSGFSHHDTSKLANGKPSLENPNIVSDSMFMFDGEIKLVDVKSFTNKNIVYTDPGLMDIYKVDRRKVTKIVYKTGLVEYINQVESEIPESKKWKLIEVTENPEDVQNFIKLGKIKGESRSSHFDTDNAALERSAIVVLKKRAMKLEADIILITDKNIYRPYGEPPSITLKAVAYKIE